MSFNLVDAVKTLFNQELTNKAGSQLGESESNVQKALGGIIPTVLAGILNKAGKGDGSDLLSMAKNALNSGLSGNLGAVLDGGSLLSQGSTMLKSLFGDKTDAIATMISNYAGIKESSANSLLSTAAPAALGAIGSHAVTNNLSASSLVSFINTQKQSILNSVPSSLNLGSAMGLGNLFNIGTSPSPAHTASHGTREEITKSSGSGWLWPIILLLLAIGLILYFAKSCKSTDVKNTGEVTAVTPDVEVPAATMETLKVTLPDGVVLDAYKGGIEDKLVAFLNDPNTKAGKDVWFDFDNLNFRTGSSELTEESNIQVNNIAAILKAYPNLEVKIGGYTDRTGDSLSNLKLSQSRADVVSSAIKTAGGKSTQIAGAEGYGSQFATASADAPDAERQKDRRIAISIRKK